MNETYEAVDSQPRPVSYLNPCIIRDSCIDEENYETLTDVQTQFSNIYERLPTAGGDTLQPTRSEKNDLPLKKKDNAGSFDENEIKKIKQDLREDKSISDNSGIICCSVSHHFTDSSCLSCDCSTTKHSRKSIRS